MTSPQGPDRPAGRPTGEPAGSAWSPTAVPVDGPEASSPVRTVPRTDEGERTQALPTAPPPAAPAVTTASSTPEPRREPVAGRGDAARDEATTVLPGGAAPSGGVRRPPRPAASSARQTRPAETATRPSGKGRRARLALQRIDPWSVFTYTLLASLFLGLALVVMVFALYTVLGSLGVTGTVNELYQEVNPGGSELFTSGRFVGGAAVLAAVNVVLLTLLATLGALLYNLISSFTGGIEVTLGDRDA